MARRQKVTYPYPLLEPGDIVCCDTRGLFPVITRMVTGGGIKRAFDHKVSTHSGLLIPVGDQIFVGEMDRSGVTINSLETKYKRRDERIICFRRVPGLTDLNRAEIVNDFAEILRRSVEYDFRGLLEFVSNRVKDNPKRMYCSEMGYLLTRQFAAYPGRFDIKVSPQDLMTTTTLKTVWHR